MCIVWGGGSKEALESVKTCLPRFTLLSSGLNSRAGNKPGFVTAAQHNTNTTIIYIVRAKLRIIFSLDITNKKDYILQKSKTEARERISDWFPIAVH